MLQISNLQTLIDFFSGVYGQGQSGSPVEAELTADLDFADMPQYYFAGGVPTGVNNWYVNFNGNGHQIKNIYCSGVSLWFLFPNLQEGYIANLWLTDLYVIASDKVALVRNMYGSAFLKNVHVTGTMQGGSEAAGMVVSTSSASTKISECSFSGNLSATNVGGILRTRSTYSGKIINCCVLGKITATTAGAGIADVSVSIINCFFRGIIEASKVYPIGLSANTAINSYAVLYGGTSNTVQSVAQNNCLYDSTIATAEGITVPALTPATTAELHDASYMRNAGFVN